jgi:hypothetical protein
MATYKEIFGQKINKLSSDPSNALTGEMWYNSASGTLRGLGIVEAWSSASPLSTARQQMAGAGIQTAALGFGGNAPPYTNKTEEYNGTGWATGGTLNTARFGAAGFGIQTNAVAAGGYSGTDSGPGQNQTEEYNGTAWTSGNNMGTGRRQLAGAGVETAGLVFGGRVSDPTFSNASEEYDGTNWTAGGTMNTPAPSSTALAGCGTQTAGLRFGGSPSVTANTETYDGTSWTEVNDMNTGRGELGGNGNQTSALAYGGGPPTTAKAELWNGTSWTEGPDLATARINIAGAGASNSAAVAFGGGPPQSSLTEEFTSSTNAITAAAWASGGTYPYQAGNVVSLGPATAMLSCGGNNSGPTKQTTVTLYNGTSYSSETAMPAAANGMGQGKGGTETAGLVFGGSDPGSTTATTTILYNGSSWTSGGALSTGRRNLGGLGISTAALAFGGQEPSYSTSTEEYGGSSWTSGGALPAGRRNPTGVGSQTAGLVLGGQSPPGAGANTSFTYNGTSYSNGPTMINSRSDAAASGPNSSNTSALVYGGSAGAPPYTVTLPTETFDGSSFFTAPSLSTGRDGQGSGGSATEGVQVGGYVPSGSYLDSTEQFTPESTSANIKTFSTS